MRIVADTNIVVSALLWRGNPRRLLDAARDGIIELFTSAVLLEELEEVLSREKFASRLEAAEVTSHELILGYAALATIVEADSIEPVIVADVAHERVDVFHQGAEILGRATLAGRPSMPARVPGEDRDVVQREHLHEFRPAPGMFVAAMEKQQRFLRAPFRDPGAIKELGAIPA